MLVKEIQSTCDERSCVLPYQATGCVMPEDVKVFYSTHNGIDLQWSYLHQGIYNTDCTH